MKTYENFLKEKIHSSVYKVDAHFVEEYGKVFIVDDNNNEKILFKMVFTPEYYDVLLIAALQLLETIIMLNKGESII